MPTYKIGISTNIPIWIYLFFWFFCKYTYLQYTYFLKKWKYTYLQYTYFFEKIGIFQNENIPKKKTYVPNTNVHT